jgi:hypothetical protein
MSAKLKRVPQEARIPNVPNNGIERAPMIQLQDRRRSERLLKNTTLTTKEKTNRMTKKKTWKVLILIRICFLFFPMMILLS